MSCFFEPLLCSLDFCLVSLSDPELGSVEWSGLLWIPLSRSESLVLRDSVEWQSNEEVRCSHKVYELRNPNLELCFVHIPEAGYVRYTGT
ncbi:hypothetical protein TB2_044089 [Malus domestica]